MERPSEDTSGDTKQPEILAIVILFPTVTTIVIALRLWQRCLMKQFHWDDGFICIAWALTVAQAGVFHKYVQMTYSGYHIWDIPPSTIPERVENDKFSMAQQLLYNPILGLAKASILVFLMRLGDKRRFIFWALHGLFWFNMGHLISVFFAALTQCLPIHMYWDHHYTDELMDGEVVNDNYQCFHEAAFSLVTAGLAILTDVLILLMPIAMMWNLRMPVRQKVAVGAVLSLGWVVAVIGCIRFKSFYDFWFPSGPIGDPTYSVSVTLSSIEINIAIMCACGPAVKALITRFAPKFFGSLGASRPTGNVYYSPRGYELSSNAQSKPDARSKSRTTTGLHSALDSRRGQRDADADSQEAIVGQGSLTDGAGPQEEGTATPSGWR